MPTSQSIAVISSDETLQQARNYVQVKEFYDALTAVNNKYNQNPAYFIYNRVGYRVNIGTLDTKIVVQLEQMNKELNVAKETNYSEAKMKLGVLILQNVVYMGAKLIGSG